MNGKFVSNDIKCNCDALLKVIVNSNELKCFLIFVAPDARPGQEVVQWTKRTGISVRRVD